LTSVSAGLTGSGEINIICMYISKQVPQQAVVHSAAGSEEGGMITTNRREEERRLLLYETSFFQQPNPGRTVNNNVF
jgi:hypothetical protein